MRLEVTRRAGLAVRAIAELAPVGRRVKGGELAEALQTTPGFVPQVIGPLVKAGWVASIPGPAGGYALTVDAARLSVLDIVEAIDGPTDTGRCVIEGHPCGSAGTPCALHAAWAEARATLTVALAATRAAPEHVLAAVPEHVLAAVPEHVLAAAPDRAPHAVPDRAPHAVPDPAP